MFQPRMTASELALVARVIYEADPMYAGVAPDNAGSRRYYAERFADALEAAKVNSQFDRARFIRAAVTGVNTKEATR